MARVQLSHSYNDIISPENLLEAWSEFLNGKRARKDVQKFQIKLMDNILDLHQDLKNRTYRHGNYHVFNICDPKPRNIHKASVRDRLLHHAIYRKLYPFFDRAFISDLYSCRLGKGTHRALQRFIEFGRKVSRNNTRTCWILKCDVKKFFASVDQAVLLMILEQYIPDKNILWLLEGIVLSFYSGRYGVGLPLGNLTSQLLVNIYMNEFDQFIKHKLKAKYYIRYADDFVILSHKKGYLESLIPRVELFLKDRFKLSLHPDKVFIKTLASGVDFLGWLHFPDYRVLRTATKRRMLRNIREKAAKKEVVESYLGLLSHGNAQKLKESIKNAIVFFNDHSRRNSEIG